MSKKQVYPVFVEGAENGDLIVKMDKNHIYIIGNMEGSCQKCHEYGRLFAAAPELLAVLTDLVIFTAAMLDDENDAVTQATALEVVQRSSLRNARAALAKATGGA